MLSGKTPKKSHIFLLTEEQPRREIHLQQDSELQRDGNWQSRNSLTPGSLQRVWRKGFSDPRGRMPGSKAWPRGSSVRCGIPILASRTDEIGCV
ncbi:hypothetical protein FJ936_02150 [Mesorhizobium sp. B2-4-13]|nr:hypothetical protein FJ936_02150 [Mesorhizobium sp. B2-4-13]